MLFRSNYLTIGYDCSPAAALRNLNLRDFALPFDWVISRISGLETCFKSNFENYHKKLVFNPTKTRLIDAYGFEYPHDYPLNGMSGHTTNIGEGVFGEEHGKSISDNWEEYYSIVLEKYNRRIERFLTIVNDTKPIVVLCRYNTDNVLKLRELLMKYYKIKTIYFINSTRESYEDDTIKNIYTEKNNVWNDVTIWKEGLDDIIKKIDSNPAYVE